MSYGIELLDPVTKELIEFDTPHQMNGGTYAIGGNYFASLNITWNYSEYFYKLIDKELGIRYLYGKTGLESIPILEKAISQLKDDVDEDYWKITEGNAKRALIQLLTLAKTRPDGIFDGD